MRLRTRFLYPILPRISDRKALCDRWMNKCRHLGYTTSRRARRSEFLVAFVYLSRVYFNG